MRIILKKSCDRKTGKGGEVPLDGNVMEFEKFFMDADTR